jgi:hypothetical protein
MKILVIAQVAHAINAAYCLSLGDTSVPAWEDAGEQHQLSIQAGVQMHLDNPDATPEDSHAAWLADKVAQGWVYGEAKDTEAKTHPCCRPYEELPPEQKSKDYLFRAVVHALKGIPDAEEEVAAALANLTVTPAAREQVAGPAPVGVIPAGQIPVEYIGRRPTYTDHLYGTGLVFEKGQVRNLPSELARKFLRHGDQFAENVAREGEQQIVQASAAPDQDDTAAKLAEAQKLQELERDKESQLQDLKVQVNAMTKTALGQYALTNYQQKLDQSKTVAELRAQVIGMIDQFGPV